MTLFLRINGITALYVLLKILHHSFSLLGFFSPFLEIFVSND